MSQNNFICGLLLKIEWSVANIIGTQQLGFLDNCQIGHQLFVLYIEYLIQLVMSKITHLFIFFYM